MMTGPIARGLARPATRTGLALKRQDEPVNALTLGKKFVTQGGKVITVQRPQ